MGKNWEGFCPHYPDGSPASMLVLPNSPTEPVCEPSLHDLTMGVHTSVTVSLMLPVIREVPIPSLCRHGFRSL